MNKVSNHLNKAPLKQHLHHLIPKHEQIRVPHQQDHHLFQLQATNKRKYWNFDQFQTL